MDILNQQFTVIVPAAGVGKRMLASCPKQYLQINNETILAHTVNRLLSHKSIAKVILALGDNDEYFAHTSLAQHPDIIRVSGGVERVDSVLNGLYAVDDKKCPWVLVHDAARPCVTHKDIDQLIKQCLAQNTGGLLAAPVVDTMKQCESTSSVPKVSSTVDRTQLWHALTPQMYKTVELRQAIEQAQRKGITITDESSAIELAGLESLLVSASRENIKITRPEDLALAAFYLEQQKNNIEDDVCA
ncbi:MAG: 2-C-methyl-D-erythritol 4-phosphate cytidylyltransferase [Colwellia sp.]|nr:2-C-methyl-D-erythritol 4-phosphate cytidylyltransferase [Colwellia sp.]MCW8863945.1 2-C-methyl-D-erythritol 4-phosphate cytidylyltransferase [Colwellia sp.]MCW9081574.1 2-C-methyl-D-erythritol 4-phosphate cytidylyltransferase [Colwellia sp.]